MVPHCQPPRFEYTIANLERHGITEIILNLHNQPALYKGNISVMRDAALGHLDSNILYELTLLGTAGGVKERGRFLEDKCTFLVMSGDGLTTIDLTRLFGVPQAQEGA